MFFGGVQGINRVVKYMSLLYEKLKAGCVPFTLDLNIAQDFKAASLEGNF